MPTIKIELPDGRVVKTTSTKRWQVVVDGTHRGLHRSNSSDSRDGALKWWRHWSRYAPAWLIDMKTMSAEREPLDSTGSIPRP